MTWEPPERGALDDTAWPDKLTARAVDVGHADDRMFGYGVLGDVGPNYRYSDLVYLSIVGELPDESQSSVFHVALCSYAAVSVGESSVHVSVLARLSGAHFGAAISAGMVAAADQVRQEIERHSPLLSWLATAALPMPIEFLGMDPRVQTLIETVARVHPEPVPAVRSDMTWDAARIALCYGAGLQRPEQIEAAILAAQLCSITAESLATGPQHLGLYPVKVPEFRYIESDDPRSDDPVKE